MADPVELILDFLQKHQFLQAEAAFKAELLARTKQECFNLSAENVLKSDEQLHTRLSMESIPNKGTRKILQNGTEEPSRVSEAVIRISEKQLHTDRDPGKPESLLVISSIPHDYENVRPSLEAEFVVPCKGDDSFISSSFFNAIPANSRIPFRQIESSGGTSRVKPSIQENRDSIKPTLTFLNDALFTNPQLTSVEPTGNQNDMLIQGSLHQNKDNQRGPIATVAGYEGATSADVRNLECGKLINMDDVKILPNSGQGSEELPRLPPVRIHSIDKNMDSKDAGSGAENEASTRSFESAAIRSIGCESGAGWVDAPLSQDMSSTGLKRLISRPSVSQGIVEDMSEQLSGFASAVDGQSERWYPDEYCDSDTWDDDDDPGYHRQPIEDEEWFLANEIDYPSDVERSKHHTNNDGLPYLKHPKELDEDERSFVEEDSYFSGGEECNKLQAAAKDGYSVQQALFNNEMDDSQSAYSNMNSISKHDVTCNDFSSDFHDAAYGLNNHGLQQTNTGWAGSKMGSNGRPDDDNHDSVKSGSVQPNSDVADIGSDLRDSIVDVSSEADTESFRDQELIVYGHAYDKLNLDNFGNSYAGRHVQVKNAPVQHFDEDENDHVVFTQFQQGWSKRTNEKESAKIPIVPEETVVQQKANHLTNCNNKTIKNNGSFVFEGFSFPSPSSTGDIMASQTGPAKSIWLNKVNMAQVEETGGSDSRLVTAEGILATRKPKSNNSSPVVEDVSTQSVPCLHSADVYYSSLEATEDKVQALGVNNQLQAICQASGRDEDNCLQEEMRTQVSEEDQYEIFDLRVIHRKNRTGFEEDKDFPVIMNSVIAGRYHVTEYLGSAAFSKAIQAHDLQTGMDVCMKIIKNNKDFFDQSLDEIKLLKYINKHDPADKYHILRLYDYFYHREHLFIVCELLRANLYEFHKYNRESGGEVYFTMPRMQSITIQCLEALEFLHKLGIIHCDLKPENILVKSYSRCEIKIIDLGSSCFQTDHLCSYVQSRSYRAPEVILGLPYDQKIDIWSLGCILAELCTGNVLFQNDSLATLLARVVGIMGPIDPEVLAKGRDTYKYFTKNYMLYERNQETDQLEYLIPKKTSLSHRLPMGDQGFIEFVSYLLQSNPAKRPTASEALQHPWLSYPYEPISS